MFTGMVERMGTVTRLQRRGDGARIELGAPGLALRAGESIAVDGACLTALLPRRGAFAADLSGETLARTALGGLAVGDRVNLERPVRVGDRLGGHFVLGHVDATGAVEALEPEDGGARLVVSYPVRYHPFVVEKGSIAVNGVSLTIASAARGRVAIALIPHTLGATNLGALRHGDRVNVEFDYLAKVVLGSLGTGRGRKGS